jgi:small multidrug resistance pump
MDSVMPSAVFYLVLTVGFEVFGTACIQASQQFSRPIPSLGVVLGYGAAFWFLSLALKTLPLGIVYATWSGMGIVLVTMVGYFIFGQRPDLPAMVGMALIITGLATMHLFSKAAA